MPIDLEPLTYEATEYICLHLRDRDAQEIYGLRWTDSPLALAQDTYSIIAQHGVGWVALWDGRPVATLGIVEKWPRVWQVFSYGTDDWRRSVLTLSRHGKTVIKDYLLSRDAHRLECETHCEHIDAHRWLEMMGAEKEGIRSGYGKDGSDYITYVWRQ